MSEPRVTITLGRSGKVVKNGGSKRSFGEWDFDGLTSSASKRHRGDSLKFRLGHGGADGLPIAENDLRLKLIRKQRPKQSWDVVDQRGKMESLRKMSRPVQHSSSSYLPTHRPHGNASGLPGQYHPGELRSLDSLGKVYSPQSVGGARSPDKVWRQSIVISPPRNFESRRPADIPRYGQYRGSEVLDAPRLAITAPPTSLKPISPAVGMVSRVGPANGILPKVPSLVEEHTTVAGFLNSLGLGKYAVLFKAEEVDMTILKQMGDKDLKDMGIPMVLSLILVVSLINSALHDDWMSIGYDIAYVKGFDMTAMCPLRAQNPTGLIKSWRTINCCVVLNLLMPLLFAMRFPVPLDRTRTLYTSWLTCFIWLFVGSEEENSTDTPSPSQTAVIVIAIVTQRYIS